MKELLLETARRTGLVDDKALATYFEDVNGDERIDEALLRCPFLTEDVVLRLFAAAMGWQYLAEVPVQAVPPEFIESVPPTYAQHHFLIGVKTEALSSHLASGDPPPRTTVNSPWFYLNPWT